MSLITNKLLKQKAFYNSHQTKTYDFRIKQLKKLKATILKYENEILAALKHDLNKSKTEGYMTELALVLDEIHYFEKNLRKLMRKNRVASSLTHFKSSSFTLNHPYGCVLIVAPWNYPFQLSFVPLIGAIAAGNCVILKPSDYAPATTRLTERIVAECFDDQYVTTQLGGRTENQELFKQNFDYIFFTGSTNVGKIVAQEAAKSLIPVSLELGGKSPCIVDESAKVDLAAKRIVWGKLINAGQTCVAVDYVYVHSSVKAQFIESYKKYCVKFFTEKPINNTEYPKIINEKHYKRLCGLLENQNIIFGGFKDNDLLKISPTLVEVDSWDNPLMQEEIFGPILPILTFDNLDEVFDGLADKDAPLSCYMFAENPTVIKTYLNKLKFGGGCINDVLIHVANNKLPFGGVGASGIGRYHGKASFETFTYLKTIMRKTTLFDIYLRYAPYDQKFKLIKTIMRWFG